MHFVTTVAIHLPPTTEDKETDKEVFDFREDLKKQLEIARDIGPKVTLECRISELGNHLNAFGRAVAEEIEEVLEPYCECTENPEYLDFDDMTDEIERRYKEGAEDCVRMPDGKIKCLYCSSFRDKFTVKDGVVYEKNWGPLKSLKRTKRAKKIKFLKDYPFSKRYPTINEFAEQWFGCEFDEKTQHYGRYYNFNSLFDWYRIGGRWPKTFLVKSDCSEYSIGNIDDVEWLSDVPEGYKWTSAARKKDICWDAVVAYRKQKEKECYEACKKYFEAGTTPEKSFLHLKEDGVYNYDNKPVYIAGETLEEYLKRRGYTDDTSYLMTPCYFVDSEVEGYYSEDSVPFEDGQSPALAWLNHLRDIYADLDDDAVLVTVDIHQ